jgi:HlyD family secretion protein
MNSVFTIALIALLFFSSCKQKKEEIVSPIEAPVTEAVFAPGHIEADGQFTLTAINDGYIKAITVQEGDTVHTGQILIVQDNTTAAIQQQTATDNLHIAEQQSQPASAVLQQLQAQLNSANDKLQNDKMHLERMQRLYATNSVAKIDLDNAQLTYNNSLNNVSAIQQNIAATKQNLQQALVNSRGQQQTAIANNNYYNLKSPGNYKVYTVFKKKGELVRKGEAVAVLGNPDKLKILLSIDEASIAKIQLQQKVLIELNTEKGKIYTGYISKIYSAFDLASQSYNAEAIFDNAANSVINGTLLQANIIVASKDKALLIPNSCLMPDGKVVLKNNGKTDTVSIKTGIISTDWAEVLAGLTITDRIIKQY